MDAFVMLLFGHVVGDYFLQPTKMAIYKSKKDLDGIKSCIWHSNIYMWSVMFFMWYSLIQSHAPTISFILFPLIVWINHFVIDHWSLGQKYMDFVRSRNCVKDCEDKSNPYMPVTVAFGAIVYVIVDNSMHLMINWAAYKLLEGV